MWTGGKWAWLPTVCTCGHYSLFVAGALGYFAIVGAARIIVTPF